MPKNSKMQTTIWWFLLCFRVDASEIDKLEGQLMSQPLKHWSTSMLWQMLCIWNINSKWQSNNKYADQTPEHQPNLQQCWVTSTTSTVYSQQHIDIAHWNVFSLFEKSRTKKFRENPILMLNKRLCFHPFPLESGSFFWNVP